MGGDGEDELDVVSVSLLVADSRLARRCSVITCLVKVEADTLRLYSQILSTEATEISRVDAAREPDIRIFLSSPSPKSSPPRP